MSKRTMELLDQAVPVFTILTDKTRQSILMSLFDDGKQTVSEITNRFSLTQPAVSYHLKLLTSAGLVSSEKKGRERYYSVQFEKSLELLEALITSIKHDAGQVH